MYEVSSPRYSGRVIAVWSPVSRQGGVSTLAAMLISYLASKSNSDEKTLLISNEISSVTAVWYLSSERVQSGLADVVDLATSDNLKSVDDIYNNSYTISNNVDVLTSSRANVSVSSSLGYEIDKIFNIARNGYKYVVVDVPSGESELSNRMLSECDIIVVSLPQDKYIFDGWVKKMQDVYTDICETKPTVTVLQQFFNYSTMSYQYMQKKMGNTPLYYIDLNTLVYDSVSDRNIYNMIIEEANKKSHRDEVIDQLEAIVQYINEKVDEVVASETKKEQEYIDKIRNSTMEYMEEQDMFFDMGYEEDKNGLNKQVVKQEDSTNTGLSTQPEKFEEFNGSRKDLEINIESQDEANIDMPSDDLYS